MPSDQNKNSGLSLDSYSLESGPTAEDSMAAVASPSDQPADAAALDNSATPPALPVRIILRGSGFLIGALDPEIRIGDVRLRDFEISSDSTTIFGYLHEIPPEGSVITIDYGRAGRAELPERFSLSKLRENP